MAHDFSDVQVESWEIDRLVPYEQNHKKHTPETVKARADSIAEYGLEHPIAVEEDGTIISGHGRRLSLILLGKKFAPVRVFKGITKDQANKLRIAANKTTSNDYDTDILTSELLKLTEAGIDLDGMGFTEKEMTILLKDIGEIDLGTISTDIVGDIANHEQSVSDSAKAADAALVPIAKAFGFKFVESSVARTLTRFLGVIEEQTGKAGVEALAAHMAEVVDAG